ncbi:sti1 [Symbiodinium pilosum]|uniref:Sti1 protein n=1 Tax=Symbiodinium pilosum TaxID=2952 RepID=A0A812XVG3_SYMPI|nr:sti1 [Symbiodinium pilosum]
MAQTPDFVDHYAVLGCSPKSSHAELKRAYHEQLREYHPDKRPNSKEGRGKKITASLNQAWEILQDEQRREQYDRIWQSRMEEPVSAADECRRSGNELYRAACLLAQKHSDAHENGMTFGVGEGLDWAKQALEKYQAAIEAYSQGLEAAPGDHRLYNNRALCFAALKMWGRCQEDAKEVIRLKPDFKKGWFLLAKALWKEGRLADAKKELDAGLQIVPDCADLLDLQAEIQNSLAELSGGQHLPSILMRRGSVSRNVSPVGTPPPSSSSVRVQPPPPIHKPMPPRRQACTSPTPPGDASGLGRSQSLRCFNERQASGSRIPGAKSSSLSPLKHRRLRPDLGDTLASSGLEATARFGDSTADFGEKIKLFANHTSGLSGVHNGSRTLWELAQLAGIRKSGAA